MEEKIILFIFNCKKYVTFVKKILNLKQYIRNENKSQKKN
jgi:hypothetical protein